MTASVLDVRGAIATLRRQHFVPALALVAVVSACGGGGGGGGGTAAPPQVGFGSASLSWTPPTQNADGSVLTDLSGYRIYYGHESGNYPMSVQIDNPGIARYVVDNLTPNTYFFVLTAIDSNGLESEYSNEAFKEIF